MNEKLFYEHAWADRQKLGRAESLRVKCETLFIQIKRLLILIIIIFFFYNGFIVKSLLI